MSYKSSSYAIRIEESDGIIRHFVSFKNGQSVFHEIEVSYEMYLEFRGFISKEHNMQQSDWRHKEFSNLTDETLCGFTTGNCKFARNTTAAFYPLLRVHLILRQRRTVRNHLCIAHGA